MFNWLFLIFAVGCLCHSFLVFSTFSRHAYRLQIFLTIYRLKNVQHIVLLSVMAAGYHITVTEFKLDWKQFYRIPIMSVVTLMIGKS